MSQERNRGREEKESTRIIDREALEQQNLSDSVDKVLLTLYLIGAFSWVFAVCSI